MISMESGKEGGKIEGFFLVIMCKIKIKTRTIGEVFTMFRMKQRSSKWHELVTTDRETKLIIVI